MILRSFILSLLLLSYGSIIGHEVVFGHHTTAEVNCHHHGSDCCDHHGNEQDHIPCTVDVNPHFSDSEKLIVLGDEGLEIDLGFFFVSDFHTSIWFPDKIQDLFLVRVAPDDYSSSFYRSHRLRGPPNA